MTIGFVTLCVGEQALIYNLNGAARIEEGPKRMFLWREKIIHLNKKSANQQQYLQITYREDGKIENIAGPCAIYQNPLKHLTVSALNAVSLDANECVVVYTQDEKSKEVSRYILDGPTMFIPKANEWLHEFSWHGTDPNNKTRVVVNGNKFTKLKVIPDQFYYNVDEVRTSDDALLRVKLMLFYEITSVEQMLDTTIDPIGDFVNTVTADVIAFAAQTTYMEFIEHSGRLNDMDVYKRLTAMAKKIGFEMTKVVFRGYFASPKLQEMHDEAMETRTRLRISMETESQHQDFLDNDLRSEIERLDMEHGLAIEKLNHKTKIELKNLEHDLKLVEEENKKWCKQKSESHKVTLETRRQGNALKLEEYRLLNEMGVDVNAYVLSQSRQPEKITRIVSDPNTSNLHIHQKT